MHQPQYIIATVKRRFTQCRSVESRGSISAESKTSETTASTLLRDRQLERGRGVYLLVVLVQRGQHLEGPGRRNSGSRQSLVSLHCSQSLLLKPPTLKACPSPLAPPPLLNSLINRTIT